MERYLQETKMLDYSDSSIQRLVERRCWKEMPEFERLKAIYQYVRDEILFGYNVDDGIAASRVLRDGYGQCNTKGTLFMALLRACGIPCRVHGFTIDKKLQKGAMTGFVYRKAPQNIFHSWVEVYFENQWYELEAFILDRDYLLKLQDRYPECTGAFCGYGVAVKDFRNPVIDFDRNNTYIQSEGINQDFGVYDSPDELLREHHQELSAIKSFAFRHLGRHLMNLNVRKIRNLATRR
ncbi:MAG: transglutaminase-like domain-containing protein [Bacteroidales bacterium]|nr:transglutaminase-like domain-containing protein [Bacteroidales bacterium]